MTLAFSFTQNKEAVLMWGVITHTLCIATGTAAGVILMCLMQVAKQADEQIERRNEI